MGQLERVRQNKVVSLLVVVFALAFVFAIPVVSVSSTESPPMCIPNNQCTALPIHYTESLDCYLLGAGPGQWIGVYYFDGSPAIGCGPLFL